jgi:hypothetical protein
MPESNPDISAGYRYARAKQNEQHGMDGHDHNADYQATGEGLQKMPAIQ